MRQQTITTIILTLCFLVLGQTAIAEEGLWLYFVVDKQDNVSLDSFNVWPEESGGIWNEEVPTENAFEVRILNSTGSVFDRVYFIPDFLILSDPPIEVDETVAEVVFPYSQNISTVQVWKGAKLLLTESIGGQLCNNDGACNNKENYPSCPLDCSQYSEDGYCNSISNDGFCDPDCPWDTETGGECTKANCNDGIKNQDETGIDIGGICRKLKCENNIQDLGEEGIDCGGVCSQWWQCAEDFCGDTICAEYESETDCPADCGELVSVLKNNGTEALKGYLLFKVQKYDKSAWNPYANVFRDTNVRTIGPGETVNLKEIWNGQNYIVQEDGRFRIFAGFLNEAGVVKLSDTFEFYGGEQMASAHEPEPEPTGFKGTIYKIQRGVTNFFRDITSYFKIRLWR